MAKLDIKTILRDFGLKKNEIVVYLASLEIGTSAGSKLAKKTGITRSTTQYICQQLTKKGFMSVVGKNNSFLYTAEGGDKLLFLLDQEKVRVQDKMMSVKLIRDDLDRIAATKCLLPQVKFFEGRSGVISAYSDLMKYMDNNTELLNYADIVRKDTDHFKLRKVLDNFKEERTKRGIKLRMIVPYSETSLLYQKNDSKFLAKTFLVNSSPYQFGEGEDYIYKNRLYHISVKENHLFAYMAESNNIAERSKALFEIAWKQAEREHNEIFKKMSNK